MKSIDLKNILLQYPPSRLLKVFANGEHRFDMTIAEMCCNLMSDHIGKENDVALFGYHTFIIRERGEATDDVPGAAPWRDWIELDAR